MYQYAQIKEAYSYFNVPISGFQWIVVYGDDLEKALERVLCFQFHSQASEACDALNTAYNAGKNDTISVTNEMILDNI